MIISWCSGKGGVGKSTLCHSIAHELMSQGKGVLLVDADPQATCRHAAEVAQENGHPTPPVIGMGADLAKPGALPKLAKGYDFVLVDTPGQLGPVLQAAVVVSNAVIIPVGQSAADAWAILDTVECIREVSRSNRKLRAALVLCKKVPGSVLANEARAALAPAKLPLFKSDTAHRQAWMRCLDAGQGVAQYAPKSAAADELRAVLAELIRFTRGDA